MKTVSTITLFLGTLATYTAAWGIEFFDTRPEVQTSALDMRYAQHRNLDRKGDCDKKNKQCSTQQKYDSDVRGHGHYDCYYVAKGDQKYQGLHVGAVRFVSSTKKPEKAYNQELFVLYTDDQCSKTSTPYFKGSDGTYIFDKPAQLMGFAVFWYDKDHSKKADGPGDYPNQYTLTVAGVPSLNSPATNFTKKFDWCFSPYSEPNDVILASAATATAAGDKLSNTHACMAPKSDW